MVKVITPERVSERIRKQVVDVPVPKILESRRVQRIQSRQSDGRRGVRVRVADRKSSASMTIFPFTGHFVANPATKSQKTRGGIRPKCKTTTTTRQYNSVEETKNAPSAYSNAGWIVNWHLLKLCCHLKKKKHQTIQRHRGARSLFLRVVVQKRYPSNLGNVHVFSRHIGDTHVPLKNFGGHGNGAIFWDQKQACRPRGTWQIAQGKKVATAKTTELIRRNKQATTSARMERAPGTATRTWTKNLVRFDSKRRRGKRYLHVRCESGDQRVKHANRQSWVTNTSKEQTCAQGLQQTQRKHTLWVTTCCLLWILWVPWWFLGPRVFSPPKTAWTHTTVLPGGFAGAAGFSVLKLSVEEMIHTDGTRQCLCSSDCPIFSARWWCSRAVLGHCLHTRQSAKKPLLRDMRVAQILTSRHLLLRSFGSQGAFKRRKPCTVVSLSTTSVNFNTPPLTVIATLTQDSWAKRGSTV